MWPRKTTCWTENKILMVSIHFTWELPGVYKTARLAEMYYQGVVVGGPVVELMPGFFNDLDHRLSVSGATVRLLIRGDFELHAIEVRGSCRISENSLADYIERNDISSEAV
nr:hypothetical protein 12 [Deltaproteobacteria bacterium]